MTVREAVAVDDGDIPCVGVAVLDGDGVGDDVLEGVCVVDGVRVLEADCVGEEVLEGV